MTIQQMLLGGDIPPAQMTYAGAKGDQGGSSPWTNSVSFGAADPGRYLIVAIFAPSTSTPAGAVITGVTIGGIAATQLASAISSNSYHQVAFYGAYVPTGTSGNVVVTTSGGRASISIMCWRVLKLRSTTPVDAQSLNTASAGSLPVTVNVKRGGFVLSAAHMQAGSGSWTFTNVTENQDSPFPVDPATNSQPAGGSASVIQNGTLTVTATPSSPSATQTHLVLSMR